MTTTLVNLDTHLHDLLPRLVEIRHDLHAHPQLCYEETYASTLVQRELTAAGIPFQAGIATTGVVAWLIPDGPAASRPAIALRGDMDALPIIEETGLPYASTHPGWMHACGHDGHTTIALGAALILNQIKDQLPQPVKIFFQPAEEGGAGGRVMVEQGVLTEKVGGCRVAHCYGLHGLPEMPLGTLVHRAGPMMAATCSFDITVRGSGGHAAMPQHTADPIVAASQLISGAQTLVSRFVEPTDPLVVSFTKVRAGDAYNVIPDTCTLSGTIRSINDLTAEQVYARLTDFAQQTAVAHRCTAEVDLERGYPVVVNDPATTAYVRQVAESILGSDHVFDMPAPVMGGEDFAYFCQAVPSCFSFIGLRPHGQEHYPGLHTARFDFNDHALKIGIRLMCGFAMNNAT